jgi:acetyl-CoA acetyltransferase
MSEVYITGVGMTPLGRHLDQSVKRLTRDAVNAALQDAGCAQEDIEAAWFSNTRQGVLEGQHGIRGQCALRAMGFERLPIINCDNACASSSTGLNQAYAAVRAGLHDVVLVVGAEKMHFPERRELMFDAFWGGMDREIALAQLEAQAALSSALPLPPEALAHDGEVGV